MSYLDKNSPDYHIMEHICSQFSTNSPDIFRWIAPDGEEISHLTPNIETIFGYPNHSIRTHEEWLKLIVSEEDRRILCEKIAEARNSTTPIHFDYLIKDSKGSERWVRDGLFQVYDRSADRYYVCGISRDITEFTQTQKKLATSERLFHAAFDYAPIGMAILGMEGKFLQVNQALCENLGYPEEELLNKDFKELINEEWDFLNQLNAEDTPCIHIETHLVTKSNEWIWSHLSASLVRDEDNLPLYFVLQIQDITQKKRAEERLIYFAHYDIVSGLPNRSLLEEVLNQAFATASMRGDKIAIFMIDVNHLKLVNEALSSQENDALIKQIGAHLKDAVPNTDFVAHWSRETFTIVCSDMRSSPYAMAEMILNSLSKPFMVNNHRFFLQAHIGIALFPQDADTPQKLLLNAGIALHHAKKLSVNSFQFYTPEMTRQEEEILHLETLLHLALKNHEITVNYQPIYSTSNGKIIGLEALARWHSAELGWVAPDQFIPVAENSLLITEIGEWILRQACQHMVELQKAGIPPLILAVNLSGRQIKEKTTQSMIQNILHETGFDPHRLRLELTESLLMDNIQEATLFINTLRAQGIHFAIDDFGMSHSSFNYLKQFTLDSIKIDRSFVNNLTHDGVLMAISSAILAMCRALKMSVTAEGIDSQETLDFFKKAGCPEVQGFYLASPMEFEKVKDLLRDTFLSQVE